MASLIDNIKKSIRENLGEDVEIDVDREDLEIRKKATKEKATSFLQSFSGIHPAMSDEKREEARKALEERDEYRKEHNKLFDGYATSGHAGPVVSKDAGGAVGRERMRQNGKDMSEPQNTNKSPASRMRVSGGAVPERSKPGPSLRERPELRPVKDMPGVLSSEHQSGNRFADELKKDKKRPERK